MMSDILSAVGILLAIITLFYDKAFNTIKPYMEKSIPPKEQEAELKKVKTEIEKSIRTAILFNLIYFVFLWLLLPTSIDIIVNSTFNLWNFDIVNTIFIIVNCTVLVFFLISIRTIVRLIVKRRKCLTTA